MIRYILLHLDGVVLENIMAPITRSVVQQLGAEYSSELENSILSRSANHATAYLIDTLNLSLSTSEAMALYSSARQDYIRTHEIRARACLEPFLVMLKASGYRVVAYGGADRDYFLSQAAGFREFFDDEGYIQTRDIRPGVKEIVKDLYSMEFREALFIDETVAVARAAKEHDVPFIGMHSGHAFSFQEQGMRELGVRFFVESLCEIDRSYMDTVERAACAGQFWS